MSAVALPRPLEGLAYWQPVFEAESIALFPVGPDKRPLVRHWQKATPHASRSWASRFAGEQAFGFLPRRAGITVLDIDSADERFAQSLFDHYGEPKALVRTASGKFHGFYRHSGERRMVRPEGTLRPYDILGDGYSIAPYSMLPAGGYEFIVGGLEDLRSLSPLAVPPPTPVRAHLTAANEDVAAPTPPADSGRRNDTLFRLLGPHARQCDDLAALIDVAQGLNNDQADPLGDGEVQRIAASVWGYEQRGQNYIGLQTAEQKLMISGEAISRLVSNHGLKAAGFYTWALSRFGGLDTFTLPNGLSKSDSIKDISKRDVPACRQALVEEGLVVPLRRASTANGPDLFRWPN